MISAALVDALAFEFIEKILRGVRPEDSRIEGKGRDVKNTTRTARQLAAHANAARGEPIIWVFGINENAREVEGVDIGEFSTWISQVEKWFNGPPPYMIHQRHLQYDGKPILVLAFDTRGAPFVVQNPLFGEERGNPEFEVPWRYGTRTKSAARAELVRILVPLSELPECELVGCKAVTAIRTHAPTERTISLVSTVYIVSRSGGRLIVPFRRCVCRFRVAGDNSWIHMRQPYVAHAGPSATVKIGETEVVVDGAGTVEFRADAGFPGDDFREHAIDVAVEIGTTIDQRRVTMSAKLGPAMYTDGERPQNPTWLMGSE